MMASWLTAPRRVTSPLGPGSWGWVPILLAVSFAAAAGEPPLPPEPDDAAAAVRPATFETVGATRVPTAGALPLSGQAIPDHPAAPARSPLRPLGDWTVLAAIAAAFALVAMFRLTSLRRTRSLPPEVFELLGEASLGGQQTARVVRFGPRTLLIGVSSAGCQTLADLDDAQTTESIVSACRKDLPTSRGGPLRPRPHPGAQPAARAVT
jgi:hypothetical protein